MSVYSQFFLTVLRLVHYDPQIQGATISMTFRIKKLTFAPSELYV